MSKKIQVDFYRVEMPEDASLPLEEIIKQVIQLNDTARTEDIRGVPIKLHEVSQWGECWQGNMIRIRMTQMPVKASLRGSVSPFNLRDDEGMGEQTAFLYHPRTRILLLQNSQLGVSISALAKYFEKKGNLSSPIAFDPVIQKDAMLRLMEMPMIRKLDIRTAGLDNAQLLEGQGYGVKEITQLSQELRAPTMELSLSVGRGKNKSLSKERAVELIHSLLRVSNQNARQVGKVRVTGLTEDKELVFLDLLRDRMRENLNLGQNKKRNIDYAERKEALRKAWNNRQDELFSMFLPPTF
jgi:hypothetical protein